MEAFWKAAAVAVLTIILGVTLGKTEKDLSLALTVAGCCVVVMVAMQYLSEVIGFLWELEKQSGSANPFIPTLLKISGVALMTELTGVISSDAGNSSLGKAMQILGTSVILFLSIPLFESLLAIIQELVRII